MRILSDIRRAPQLDGVHMIPSSAGFDKFFRAFVKKRKKKRS